MRKVLVIGIGTGNPEHVTVQAINALRRVDVVLVVDKGPEKTALADVRREICERYMSGRSYRMVEIADPVRDAAIASYEARVDHWHDQRVLLYEQKLAQEVAGDGTAAILVWGDPSLYDSTLRMLERMIERRRVAFDYEVIPGITSPQALAARHGIALNRVGGAVQLTTGRRLARGVPQEADDVVVMLDGDCAFAQIPSEGLDIYWGAYLGMPQEIAIAGALGECKDDIVRARTAARERHGWIMDSYLLRRRTR